MPKLTARFLQTLISSVTGLAGVEPDAEMKTMMDFLLPVLLAKQDDKEFREFIEAKMKQFADEVRDYQEEHSAIPVEGGEPQA